MVLTTVVSTVQTGGHSVAFNEFYMVGLFP